MRGLQELYAGLKSLRTILKDHHNNSLSMKIKQDIGDAVCDAGVIICSLHHSLQTDVYPGLPNLLEMINSILAQFGGQVPVLNFASQEDHQFPTSIQPEEVEVNKLPLQTSEVVGFHEEEILIMDQLTSGSEKLQIVAIVGMPGIGKTTLATKVYNNPYVLFHFYVRAWCPISQPLEKNRVLRDLLKQIDPSRSSVEPADSLRKSLKGRRYLIFLDDVWSIEAWTSLKQSFPDDNVGSRIILTSRQHDVAPFDLMVNSSPHSLHLLNEEASLELLQNKLPQLSLLPPDVGLKIARKCSGLPLTIVIVAGVLKTTEPKCWDGVLDDLSLSIVAGTQQTLELSYKYLQVYLRKCLLYFGIFKEDEEVSVRKLICLWIAEGFIRKGDMKSQEDAAEDYLKDLIGRSLIMVSTESSLGGAKTCRIHDLVHDFCVQQAKDEGFFHFLRGYGEILAFNEPRDLQRLCIHPEAVRFKCSKLFCPRASALTMNASQSSFSGGFQLSMWLCQSISAAILGCKLVRVLDLEQVFVYRFPSEIQHLLHLAFLAIRSITCLTIPEWIGELSNLETLILRGLLECELPDSLWNLHKLRYLYVCCRESCYLPVGNIGGSSNLHEMDVISGVVIHRSEMECILRKFPNIRKLKCLVKWRENDGNNLVVSNNLIESLNLSHPFGSKKMLDQLCLPEALKKLTLQGFILSRGNISTIGELPNLEALKLRWIIFEGETWEMKKRELPKLKFLELARTSLVKWLTDCDVQLNCLQKLVLSYCSSLEEMPFRLEKEVSMLEVIEVNDCPDSVLDMVKQIKQNQVEMTGDSYLQIIIRSRNPPGDDSDEEDE